jgi:transposase
MLYDLTSTYVEGDAQANPLLRRGYSRDHRPDCLQLVLALIVNAEGFPCSYEVFNGNRADVTTMEVILRLVERKYGKARRIWVMDRGIVSEANLAAIRKREGQYLVGTPRRKMKEFEPYLKEETHWEQVRDEVQVKLISIPGGTETFILCKTEGRQQKEQAIRNRFATRIEKALNSLQQQVSAGRLKNRDKIHVRIGRILASHPQVADLYQVAVKEQSGPLSLEWSAKEGQQQWRETREGAYLLRTNLTATTAAELWEKYMQLTEVEAAFRALKSELSIRPLFHQLERRVKAHVLVAFLGYALWVTLKHLLAAKQSAWSASRALAELATLQSADIVLPTTDGREIRLRRLTEPTAEQKRLLDQLGIELPEQLQFNQQCSADFAVA